MRPESVRLAGYLAAAAFCLQPLRQAHADEPDARSRAQELLDQGNGLFRGGDARGALERYRTAFEAFPSPKLFLNIALCEERLGDRPQAMRDFARFLAETPDVADDTRAQADERSHALAAALAAIDVVGPANAVVQLDGSRVGLTPLKVPLWAEPGLHRLVVEHAGRPPWVTTVVGRAGARVSIIVPEPAPPPVKSPGPPPLVPDRGTVGADTHPRRWWLWTGLGLVLVGGALTTFLILRNRCPPAATAGCE